MKEPENISCFFAQHANGRQAASNSPGLKNSHNTTPNFITPQANNTFPLPGAAKHNPPKADETVGGLAADNQRKQSRREGLGAKSDRLLANNFNHCKMIHFFDIDRN